MKASVIIHPYKRLECLPNVLSIVIAQDFPQQAYDILCVDTEPTPTAELEADKEEAFA